MSKIKTWEQREAEACADPKNSHRLIHTITEESKLAEIGELRGKLAALEGHGWKHVANEWADMATNGIQYMRNVKEGITTFDEALAGLAGDLEHCCEVSKGTREAQPMTRHIHENAAQLLIEYFICAELGLKNSPGFTTEKQGELESESHSWAFWILEEDTTSYLHEDGRIEWCGTGWEAEPISQPAQPQSGAREAQPMMTDDEIQSILLNIGWSLQDFDEVRQFARAVEAQITGAKS